MPKKFATKPTRYGGVVEERPSLEAIFAERPSLESIFGTPEDVVLKGAKADEPSVGLQRAMTGVQGATFGWGGELAELMGGEGEYFKKGMEAARRDRPLETLGLEVAGGILGGGAVVGAGKAIAPKTMQTLAQAARTAPIKYGAGTAALGGGVYGAGEAEEGERLVGAGKGALIGGVTGGALGYGLSKFLPKVVIPSSEEFKQASSVAYQMADDAGGSLLPRTTNKFLDKAIKEISPQTKAGKLLGKGSPVNQILENLEQLRGKRISLQEAQEVDEFIGDAIDSFVEMGKPNKQGVKLIKLQDALRKTIEEAQPIDIAGGKVGFDALKEGRRLWGKAAKMRDIEKIITRAEMMDNPAAGIKSGFRTMYNNPSRMRGFSKEEREAVKKAAESGVFTDILRTAGSRLLPIIGGATGAGMAGTAALAAGSIAARGGASRMQLSKAQKILETVGKEQVQTPSLTGALKEDFPISSNLLKSQKGGYKKRAKGTGKNKGRRVEDDIDKGQEELYNKLLDERYPNKKKSNKLKKSSKKRK